MDHKEIIEKLEKMGSARNVEGMARFGIKPKIKVLGISSPNLRKLAKEIGKNHELAEKLWDSKIHEARILASLVSDPARVTRKQFHKWIKDFDSWAVCDSVCLHLLDKTTFAREAVFELSRRKKEFEKRTAFTLMACLAVHDKKSKDKDFLKFFPLIKQEAVDDRNFVKKAVNWALRQMGKRNKNLNKKAVKLAREMKEFGEKNNIKSAKWIASDAIRELTSEKTLKNIK